MTLLKIQFPKLQLEHVHGDKIQILPLKHSDFDAML